MPIINYDCGDLSSVILTKGSGAGIVTVTSNGVVGQINVASNLTTYDFICSGIVQIDYPPNVIYAALIDVSHSTWTDNLLMGLAGIICGALLAFVMSKYAV